MVGQYEGYRDIDGVPADSRTETFVAARLWVDNDRWRGVPFLLRTGKCARREPPAGEHQFKEPAETLGGLPGGGNVLGFELSGDGEIALSLVTKQPGPTFELATGSARLPLGSAFHTPSLPAYSRLIHDVLIGRPLAVHPARRPPPRVGGRRRPPRAPQPEPVIYQRGSWGPAESARPRRRGGLGPRRLAPPRPARSPPGHRWAGFD